MSGKTFKWTIVLIAVLLAVYGLVPTILDAADGDLDREVKNFEGPAVEWIMENGKPLTLGLDLQGGLLLQYKVLVDKAVQDKLDRMARDVRARLVDDEPGLNVEVTHPEGEFFIDVQFADETKTALIDEDFMSYLTNLQETEMGGGMVRLTMNEEYIEETKKFAVQQAIETIRQRVNALGVAEPSITRRGESDIVVQLPGLKENDVERAKELIGQTAQLEFKMLDDDGTDAYFQQFMGNLPQGFNLRRIGGGDLSVTHRSKEALKQFFEGKTDANHEIGYQHHPIYKNKAEGIIDEERSYWKTYYVFSETKLTGDYIQDARVAIDQQFNRPYVALNFDTKGAELFGELSSNNVGKRMAIMLDDNVQSAPVFNEPIMGGRAQITMGSMQSFGEIQQEAQDLVIVLRHGALPAPIEMQYETVVGPTLGADSIDKSTRALLVGSILIVIFMLIYYRGAGVISVAALTFNVMFIMAGLASLGATLTLPGIAGIILTVGMAVDANVIIYERIREEVRAGRSAFEAVNSGFDKALSAVMDANITTGIAALVLMQYGTGPVKGFAVTLLIGIVSTIFTAVFIARLLFDTWGAGSSKNADSVSI
ncbi:protein translocase subunit SecD [Persicimonas caeni]|uniref:Protein translocase subunit SecD n=1 Tax=Persicimonas caeni TaxID=2292766 RepID=A0A4Y6Q1U2_PERCE|nr:protein translocase subunit SecD [Persicimonas caeni]QDG54536.1 protein translocase subunit SecD [Persicimonas caeni]QED35757.1 protein translocase subunit SecD [Persicimonas caeni]